MWLLSAFGGFGGSSGATLIGIYALKSQYDKKKSVSIRRDGFFFMGLSVVLVTSEKSILRKNKLLIYVFKVILSG